MQYLSHDVLHDVVAMSQMVLHDALMKNAALIFGSDLEVRLEE